MKYRTIEYATATYDLLTKNPSQHEKIARSLWRVLTKKKQTRVWKKIIDAVKILDNQKRPTLTIETPFPLSTQSKRHIMKLCRRSIGREIKEVQEILRPELIGGMTGSTLTHQFDWSITKQLNQLI